MKIRSFLIKIFSVLMVLALSGTFLTGCETQKTDPSGRTPTPPPDQFVPGLTTAADGTILLDGEPIYAFGANMYDPFINKRLVDPNFDLDTPFKALHDDGISVIRMSIGPYTVGHLTQYIYSPDEYFEALDSVIAACEKHHIGVFASICWNFPVLYQYTGETAESMGDESSKTVALAKKYFTDVVKRYKDSPAIWAWEFGNEYNLYNDLYFVGIGNEYIITENTSKFYKYVSTAMRAVDPYRVITGGDSELGCRPAALRNLHNWTPDDLEATIESTEFYAPSPMEVLSSHMYQYGTAGKDAIRDFDAAISMALEACHTLNKGYYIVEYGPGDFLNNASGSYEDNKKVIDLIHEACLNNKVQITLGWICVTDFRGRDSLKNANEGIYTYWYDEIIRLNSELKAQGLQDNIASYWEKAENYLYKGDDAILNKCSDHLMGSGHPGTAYFITEKKGSDGAWQCSVYDTDATIRVEEAQMGDGSSTRVFHLSNKDETSRCMIKDSYVRGLSAKTKYKLSFWLKTSGVTGSGLQVKLSSPVFAEFEGIKCDTDGEWQYFEFEVESPAMIKKTYYLTFYLYDQIGDAYICDIKLTEA